LSKIVWSIMSKAALKSSDTSKVGLPSSDIHHFYWYRCMQALRSATDYY